MPRARQLAPFWHNPLHQPIAEFTSKTRALWPVQCVGERCIVGIDGDENGSFRDAREVLWLPPMGLNARSRSPLRSNSCCGSVLGLPDEAQCECPDLHHSRR